MKVYVVTEGLDNIIRFITLRQDIAEEVVRSFSHLGLNIQELDLIGTCERC